MRIDVQLEPFALKFIPVRGRKLSLRSLRASRPR